MFEDYPRRRDWIPKPPRRLSDPVGRGMLRALTWLEEANPENIREFDEKEPLIEKKFLEQFQYHSKWPVWLTVAIGLLFIGEYFIGDINLQIYGLLFDATGAIFLALGIVRGKGGLARDTGEKISRPGVAGYGGIHQPRLKANIADTIDGIFGAGFLLFGFSLQTIALL